jgi:hypothetical protein
MDYTDEEPSRWWVLNPSAHKDLTNCWSCNGYLNWKETIPRTPDGPLCQHCATRVIQDKTPITPTYLSWLESGDPRWWSPYLCNCKGCDVEGLPSPA